MVRKGRAVWRGTGKDGTGDLTTDSGVLSNTPYSFKTRFESEVGTNPEELIAAAHAGCFTMALAFQLQGAGFTPTELATEAAVSLEKEGQGFKISKSALTCARRCPGLSGTSSRSWPAQPRRTALCRRSSTPRSPWTSPSGSPSREGSSVTQTSSHPGGSLSILTSGWCTGLMGAGRVTKAALAADVTVTSAVSIVRISSALATCAKPASKARRRSRLIRQLPGPRRSQREGRGEGRSVGGRYANTDGRAPASSIKKPWSAIAARTAASRSCQATAMPRGGKPASGDGSHSRPTAINLASAAPPTASLFGHRSGSPDLRPGQLVRSHKGRFEGSLIHRLQVAMRGAPVPPTARHGTESVRCLLAVEVSQVRVEHQVQVTRGRVEGGEDLAWCAKGQPMPVRRLRYGRQGQRQFSRMLRIDAHSALLNQRERELRNAAQHRERSVKGSRGW